MPRERFYEVPRQVWLFLEPAPDAGDSEQPEELVRQWCAFELMRAYGYAITNLVFEHPVKVGSKNYRIDILIKLDGKPLAVVECKKRGHTNHSAAVEQGISYAAARDIGAEFVVYTNGDDWQVRRRVGEVWAPVTDLPFRNEPSGSKSIDALLRTIDTVSPILHKLDEPLVDGNAQNFLSALQEFFLGSNLLTQQFDDKLRFATDVLLRVLSVGMDDEHYRLEKLSGFGRMVEEFRAARGLGIPISVDFSGERADMCFAHLSAELDLMVSHETQHAGPDVLLLRFQQALLGYGRDLAFSHPNFPSMPAEIHHTLREVLQFGFATGLDIKLPTALEATTESDMKSFCWPAWQEYAGEQMKATSIGPFELLRVFFASVFRPNRRGIVRLPRKD